MYLIDGQPMRYDLDFFSIPFETNITYVLVIGKHGNAKFGLLELTARVLATKIKGIGTCNSVLINHSGAGPLWDTGTQ